mgnify:CR=1 FL=1
MRLVLPLPLGPMTRLNGSSVRLVSRSALNFRNATEAITLERSPRPRGKSTSVVARQCAAADHAGNEAARDSAKNKWSSLLGLEARSRVTDFSHLPLVNCFIASLAGTPIPSYLWRLISFRVPKRSPGVPLFGTRGCR